MKFSFVLVGDTRNKNAQVWAFENDTRTLVLTKRCFAKFLANCKLKESYGGVTAVVFSFMLYTSGSNFRICV